MTRQGPVLVRTAGPGAGQIGRSIVERSSPRVLGGGEQFAAYLAHELRTHLATQRALLELALEDPGADAATWRELGEDILGACRQQERLLDACLALARSRVPARRREPIDLAVIAAGALRAHDLCGLDSVVLIGPAWTSGDPSLLERLAANLVSNAIRHNVRGGRIEVTTRVQSRRAHLTVSNTGPLVPAEEVQRLFQPFQRLGSSSGSSVDGVGLGLAIVQAIADLHEATVTAEAQPAGGLGIDVAFPALD